MENNILTEVDFMTLKMTFIFDLIPNHTKERCYVYTQYVFGFENRITLQTHFTYKKTTFRDNHIFVLNYPIHLCVNATFNTLYIRQYLV